MKVSRQQVDENRKEILESAGRLFRERGFDAVGIADLMKDAGLTHGGFYGHFASKEALMAAASEYALSGSIERWTKAIRTAKGDPMAAMSKGYLSTRHRDQPGNGCLFAAVGTEAARHPGVKQVATQGLRRFVELLDSVVHGRSGAARRRKAIAACAAMVGGMMMARIVDDVRFSNEILEAVSQSLESGDFASY